MNRFLCVTLGLALAAAPLAALAQDFDGSKPLVCSTLETYDCEAGRDCLKGQARDIDAPQFILLDFQKGEARAVRPGGEARTTAIESTETESGELILQGVQLGRAWSATIGQESGTMVLSVAGEGVAFVVFGACTPL